VGVDGCKTGEENRADFGLPAATGTGPGEGEELRWNGLLRRCAEPPLKAMSRRLHQW